MDLINFYDNLFRVGLELSLVALHLGQGVLHPVHTALDLVVDTGDLALQDITVGILARVATLLITVGAWIYISFL